MSQIDEDAKDLLTNLIVTKSFRRHPVRVHEHRALGHRTILITGALDFAVAGLKPLFDEMVRGRDDRTRRRHVLRRAETGAADRRNPRQVLADY